MLNYAYSALQARVAIRAIAEGHDPTIGIMHRSMLHERDGVHAYALDLMEPERPQVDAAVLRFVRETTFSGADFTLRDDGVCRLNPELARRVFYAVFSET
jgi:CRISPR/Cas system-associated endonuclease Cas1